MTKKHPKGPQEHPPSGQKHSEGEEKSSNRHVYVEPGVQIDLVKDLKQNYETSQSESTTHNKKQLLWTKISAGLLLIYVGLTLWQACSSQKTLNGLREEQRAWIKPMVAFPINLTSANVPVKFVNTGKSVALRVHTDMAFEIVDKRNAPMLKSNKSLQPSDAALIFPGDDTGIIPASIPDATSDYQLTPMELKKLANSDSYISVYGETVYSDQFGKHWTRFCWWKVYAKMPVLVDNFNVRPCTMFNDVGDGIPPK